MTLLGVDIGGTFTDFVWVDEAGRLTLHKRLTSPDDPARAVMEGLRELGVPEAALVVHGSTIATNALLERRGARTALITTAGFADVIEIGRQNRPQLYALVPRKPPPLVPREWRYEVRERLNAQGEVLVPLDPAEVDALIPQLRADGIESVAVCLLFSFLRPEHEQLIRQRLEAWRIHQSSKLSVFITLSSDLLPEYREYERTSTTVLNAYVQPLMERYLAQLEQALQPRLLRIMQSNGGCITSTQARAQAARTALSGPAGGVVGAFNLTPHPGFDPPSSSPQLEPVERGKGLGVGGEVRVITFDMGGTSTDVCLCPGEIPFTSEGEIGGLPLRLPIIDIHTVGAGGGSLARVDTGGALTVGPESAGAVPGPACYGRGGGRPTVTDANLILNRLNARHFLGGHMTLDRAAAEAVFAQLLRQLPTLPDLPALAWGVVQIANAAMERAIRRISVERGYDPRDFTLVAFGGAGPLHACELAARLGIPRVLVPRLPGVLSALGMVLADLIKDYAQTVLRRTTHTSGAELHALFAPLLARAEAEMRQDGVAAPRLLRSVDMRYVGQSFEINVPVDEDASLDSALADFHARHAQRYEHSHPQAPAEIVTVRVRAIGPTPRPAFEALPEGGTDPSAAQVGEGQAWFEGRGGLQPQRTRLYERADLQAGNRLVGPVILFQMDATTVIPPGWVGQVSKYGDLWLSAGSS